MVRIPKYIQKKMHRLAKISAEAKKLDKEIDDWFNSKGYNTITSVREDSPPSLRDDNGYSLSELSDGNDITDEFRSSFEIGRMDRCLKSRHD